MPRSDKSSEGQGPQKPQGDKPVDDIPDPIFVTASHPSDETLEFREAVTDAKPASEDKGGGESDPED